MTITGLAKKFVLVFPLNLMEKWNYWPTQYNGLYVYIFKGTANKHRGKREGKTANICQTVTMSDGFYIFIDFLRFTEGLPGVSDSKSICLQCGRPGFDPWVGKVPWRRKWQSTPVLLPGKAHGWRNLVGYSPWGCKDYDMTERLHFDLQMKKP